MKPLFRPAIVAAISLFTLLVFYFLFINLFNDPVSKRSSSQDNLSNPLTNPPLPPIITVDPKESEPERTPDAPYLQTPPEVVIKMLEMAKVQPNDLVYDLGSGDGRIVIAAAQKFGARAIGIEIDPELIRESDRSLKTALEQTPKIGDRIKFIRQDLFKTDLREATVITLYLTPQANLRVASQILPTLKKGTRIISHQYPLGELPADQTEKVKIGDREYQIYLYQR